MVNMLKSMNTIKKLMDKYENYNTYDAFYIDLLFSYSNICNIFNKTYPYFDKLKTIIYNINTINISEEQKFFCKYIYTTVCLDRGLYKEAHIYINSINYINGPNITKDNMSFFKQTDINKTLLNIWMEEDWVINLCFQDSYLNYVVYIVKINCIFCE